MRPRSTVQLTLLAVLGLAVSGCKDDDSPTGPTTVPGTTNGASQVRGTERLGWNQAGDVSRLRFRAYVDGRAVDLPGATCSTSGGEAECHSPLPSLTDGVHTIELVNVSVATGLESDRSGSITLQKISAKSSLSAFPLAMARSGAVRLESVVTIADGLSFTADVVATGVRAPAQMASLPDGRLLVSDVSGRVRVLHPGEAENREPALDASMITSMPVEPMGIASHPEFAQNRFVYLSLLEHEREGQLRLRVVRLREVGDTLGEAATLFEAPVGGDGAAAHSGPRMAFGPDRLLYVMLPPGLEFVDEPAASTPRASMLRLTDEGRAASGEQLSGITSSPLGFSWHPATGALLVLFRGEKGDAAVRSIAARERPQTMRAEAPLLRVREGIGAAVGTLLARFAPDDLRLAHALLGTRGDGSKGLARLALPIQSADGGMSDLVGDIVAGDGGTLFVATSNILPGSAGAASDVVVRLRPLAGRP